MTVRIDNEVQFADRGDVKVKNYVGKPQICLRSSSCSITS